MIDLEKKALIWFRTTWPVMVALSIAYIVWVFRHGIYSQIKKIMRTFRKKKKEVANEDPILFAWRCGMYVSASFVVFVIVCFIIAFWPQ